MVVKIQTVNGSMAVELEQFFPAPRAKARKLFRLMETGMSPEDKQAVRAWLEQQKQSAEKKVSLFTAYIPQAEQNIANRAREIAELKVALQKEKSRIAEMKKGMKTAEQVARNAPAWIKDFEEFCG